MSDKKKSNEHTIVVDLRATATIFQLELLSNLLKMYKSEGKIAQILMHK